MNSITSLSRNEFFESRGENLEDVERILKLYQEYKRAQGKVDTIHHLIAKEKGGSEIDRNRKKLKAKVHQSLHAFFGNQTPGEQFKTVLDINSRILKKEVRDRIGDILEYRNGIYVPNAYTC